MPPSANPGPTLTVVICAYTMDRWDDLVAAVESVHAQTRMPDEVLLIVDHCPELAERAVAELREVRVVAARGRPGLSAARNTGIAEAHGEILAFLDDDATADPDWAAKLLAGYRDPKVIGVGGLIRPRFDTPRPAWFPAEFDWVVGCTYTGMPTRRAPVRNLLGANMSFRHAVLDEMGGFATDLGRVGTRPLGCEETELCIRATARHPDAVLLYEPAAAVRHHVPDRRATWGYFRARCYAEGLSKAAMTRRTGTGRALASEKAYLGSTIPHAVLDALPGRGAGPSPATIPALLAGVAVTGAGYALGRLHPHPADDPSPAPQPPVADLHADAGELLRRLHDAALGGDLLDAYLAACGLDQLVEDRLRGTGSLARRTADLAAADDKGAAGHAVLRALDTSFAAAGLRPARRELEHWHRTIRHLVTVLADLDASSPGLERALIAVGEQVPARAARLLTGAVLRPPTCFRSFDQHPRDLDTLVDRFAARYPDRARPLLIIGVRTSGTYLAPLAAARARRLGYRDVTVRTTRPGERLLPGEAATLSRLRHAGGLALILDDPPSTGRSLARVARAAEHAGFPHDRVVLGYAAFDGCETPRHLAGRPAITLPPADWDIRRRLAPRRLRRTIAALLPPGTHLLDLATELPGIPTRLGHLTVQATATIATDRGPTDLPLVAEGAGLGYLGRHALAVAEALPGLVPRVYGFADGVLLREGSPNPAGEAVPPDALADYVAARRRALPLPTDRSMVLAGREPEWEIGARLLSAALGRLGTPLRPHLIDPILREILRAEHPCLTDGRVLPWLWSGDGAGWRKTDFDEGSFSHLDLATSDPVGDLAAAAILAPDAEDKLLARYQQSTGDTIGPARWCVHKLVHAWNLQRLSGIGYRNELAGYDAARIQDRAMQQLYARLYLADLDDEPRGPWCVLDLDGVLEADVLGFPMTSPAGASSLRALRAHGYRVLLATGRPVPDIQDRCAAYRLPGAVAEYGAALHDAASGETIRLLPSADPDLVEELRALPGVGIDDRYASCVRVYQRTKQGRTRLDAATVADVATRYQVTAVHGDAQTDLLPRGLDKILGIGALIQLLDSAESPIALAVGDSATDIGMLQAARLGLAPGNADRPLMRGAGIDVLAGRYQVGVAQAVTRLLGHAPGECADCRPPDQAPPERALLALLSVPEGGRRTAPARLLRLAAARCRVTRPEGGPRW